MKKRFVSLLLALAMVMSFLPGFPAANAAADAPKTAKEAVAEMTWGVNLADLYMAEPPTGRYTGLQTGYDDYVAREFYDMCIAAWFWDNSFQWISFYPTEKQDTIRISLPLPDYNAAVAESNKDWAFLRIRCGDKTGGNAYKVTLSDCKITAANGTVLKGNQDFGTNGDGIMTMEGTTSAQEDMNGWHWGNASAENNWQEEIAYFAGGWNETTQRMESGADPKYNGATFTATLTVDAAEMLPAETKVEYYYCLERYESDFRTLVDTYMAQGVDVFRLPVTWTWFTKNDGDFAIDEAWLAAVKETVDYILSKGAYCIINCHDDYLQYSFVAESDGNGGYRNFRWEDQWMEDPYKDYVDARFVAIWQQIAEYFKDCSDHLIFESMNEPSMLWYSGVDFDNWLIRQNNRINGMNKLFVDTVRGTGGNNATRILSLPVNNYCTHTWLEDLVIPEDSDYMTVQIHSYAHVVDNEWDDPETMDALFSNAAAFQAANPKVGLLVAEAGISHSLANRADPEGTAALTEAFVRRAAENGMPCLWWEDYFPVYDGYEADQTHWLYDKGNNTWRENVLNAIKTALNMEDPEETKPVETEPKETEPKETKPVETNPQETEPKETTPDNTEPDNTKPTEPEETKPEDTTPTEPKPTEPEETKPEDTTPTEPKPTEPAEPPMENPFVDVAEDAYYAAPVLWAVNKGITNGLSADTFGPDATCTRAQIVTFLWRSCGSPAPTSSNNPFADVPAGQWYTDAVLWAVENGITTRHF